MALTVGQLGPEVAPCHPPGAAGHDTSPTGRPVEADTWFAQLLAALPAQLDADASTVPAHVTAAERDALLDLARVAAHTSERWTAPISTFLAGIAYASLPADERADRLRALVDGLESDGR